MALGTLAPVHARLIVTTTTECNETKWTTHNNAPPTTYTQTHKHTNTQTHHSLPNTLSRPNSGEPLLAHLRLCGRDLRLQLLGLGGCVRLSTLIHTDGWDTQDRRQEEAITPYPHPPIDFTTRLTRRNISNSLQNAGRNQNTTADKTPIREKRHDNTCLRPRTCSDAICCSRSPSAPARSEERAALRVRVSALRLASASTSPSTPATSAARAAFRPSASACFRDSASHAA